MAKRFNVSIPDALAERLEPHKDKISLSAVMQAALERELAQLTMGDQEKQRRQSFKAAAIASWLKRNPHHTKVITAFVGHLFDKALNDGLGDIFDLYRRLYVFCRRDDLAQQIAESPRYEDLLNNLVGNDQNKRNRVIEHALDLVEPEKPGDEYFLGMEIIDFIRKEHKNPSQLLHFGSHYALDEQGLPHWQDPFWNALCSSPTYNSILGIMDERIQAMLGENEVENFILDFEGEFGCEEMEDFILELDSEHKE